MKIAQIFLLIAIGLCSSAAQASPVPIPPEVVAVLSNITAALNRRDIDFYRNQFNDNAIIILDNENFDRKKWFTIISDGFKHPNKYVIVGYLVGFNSLTLIIRTSSSCVGNLCESGDYYMVERFEVKDGKISRLTVLDAGNETSSNLRR